MEKFDFWIRDARLRPVVTKYLKGEALTDPEFKTFKDYISWFVRMASVGVPEDFHKILEKLQQEQLGNAFCFLLEYGVDPL